MGSLLPDKYDPLTCYVRAQYESVPVSDSYAFMMAMYPDTADGLDLMKGYAAVDTSNLPITSEELNKLRSRLGLGLPSSNKQNVDVWPGNPDLMFVDAVTKNFPEWDSKLKSMRNAAMEQFAGANPNFVTDLKTALGKESDGSLTLGNAIFYLDYYYSSQANGKRPTKATITGDLERQAKDYHKAFFDNGFLAKDSFNTVLANGYLKHIVALLNLKKQDLTDGNLSDKRIHQMKASLDFGSKLTVLTVLKVLGEDVSDWDATYGDTLTWELTQSGSSFTVKSKFNGKDMKLGSKSLEDWTTFMIDRMYFGSITECQKDSGAENPDNHLTRDTADSETAMQWWSNQKKYEGRVFLKQTLDDGALPLQSIDKGGNGAVGGAASFSSADTSSQGAQLGDHASPSSSEVQFGGTEESESSSAVVTDLSLNKNDVISNDKTFQYNTLDKIGVFERTKADSINIAHGESVSMGLDNLETKDIQHSLFKDISFPVSSAETVTFSSSHTIMLDGSEDTETSANGKAL